MYPQSTVDIARHLSDLGILDRENAQICGVSIELEPWQEEIVAKHPGDFARGLFHSDGCRAMNRVRRPLKDGDRWYEYPRYLFVNHSSDIHRLCGEALDRLGVAWRFSKPTTISVARREAVARLDEFVGPKY